MDYSAIESEPHLSKTKQEISENNWSDCNIGKVVTVYRDGYLVRDPNGEYKGVQESGTGSFAV